MNYTYPQVEGGYRWNMLQRIYNAIGLEPIGSGDSGGMTFLNFDRELTVEEEETVDAIMADNPTMPPVAVDPASGDSKTVFIITDVYNKRDQISAAIGLPYETYYSESVPGSGEVDQIELHFAGPLTQEQKDTVITEYGKLISLK